MSHPLRYETCIYLKCLCNLQMRFNIGYVLNQKDLVAVLTQALSIMSVRRRPIFTLEH